MDYSILLDIFAVCGEFLGKLVSIAGTSFNSLILLADTGWIVYPVYNLFTGVKMSWLIDWRANPIFSIFNTIWELLRPIVYPIISPFCAMPTALGLLLVCIEFLVVFGIIKFFTGLL